MGSSARLTLVLLLIFVLGTALLLDGKDKKDGDQAKDGKESKLAANTKVGDTFPVDTQTTGGDTGFFVGPGPTPVATGGPTVTGGGSTATPPRPRPERRRPVVRGPEPQIEVNTQRGTVRPARGGSSSTAPAAGFVVVQNGDSWWKLAQRSLGSGALWKAMQKANPDVASLHPGMKIRVPAVSGRSSTRTVSAPSGRASRSSASRRSSGRSGASRSRGLPTVHVVQPGERLWDIARKYYGKGHLYYRIADHNGLDDEDVVRAGAKLKIPAR